MAIESRDPPIGSRCRLVTEVWAVIEIGSVTRGQEALRVFHLRGSARGPFAVAGAGPVSGQGMAQARDGPVEDPLHSPRRHFLVTVSQGFGLKKVGPPRRGSLRSKRGLVRVSGTPMGRTPRGIVLQAHGGPLYEVKVSE